MKYLATALLAVFLVGCKQITTTELVNEVKDGVVLITNEISPTEGGVGTGFILEDNMIVTNVHVIEGKDNKLSVYSNNSQTRYDAEVVYRDDLSDIAVLKLKEWDKFKQKETPVNLTLGDSGNTITGDKVVVIGHPWGLVWTVSEGIISGKHRRNTKNPKFIDQVDAKLFQGNSGGPIFNEDGQIVCVSNMMLVQEGGSYGLCIPSDLVKKVLYDLSKFGEVRWRVFNIAASLTDDGSAVVLETIEPGGAASLAGLKEGDKLLEIYTPNNHPKGIKITSPDDLITELAQLKGDDENVTVLVERNGEMLTIDVKTNHKLSKDYPAS